MCPAVPTMMDFIWMASYGKNFTVGKPQLGNSLTGAESHRRDRSWPYPADPVNATIEFPHDHDYDACLFSGDTPAARPHFRRVRKNKAAAWWTRAHAHRTWHFQRDVERALFLQIVARASEAAAHTQQACAPGPGRERGHHRYW